MAGLGGNAAEHPLPSNLWSKTEMGAASAAILARLT